MLSALGDLLPKSRAPALFLALDKHERRRLAQAEGVKWERAASTRASERALQQVAELVGS